MVAEFKPEHARVVLDLSAQIRECGGLMKNWVTILPELPKSDLSNIYENHPDCRSDTVFSR
jgi:hypothetical protein